MWPILSVELAGFDRADGLVEAVFTILSANSYFLSETAQPIMAYKYLCLVLEKIIYRLSQENLRVLNQERLDSILSAFSVLQENMKARNLLTLNNQLFL